MVMGGGGVWRRGKRVRHAKMPRWRTRSITLSPCGRTASDSVRGEFATSPPSRPPRHRSPLAEREAAAHAPTGLAPVDRGFLHKRRLLPRAAPTGLVPVERRFLHKQGRSPLFSAPTGLAPVEQRFLHQSGRALKHPLCPSLRSIGASPVGASVRASLRLCRNPHSTGASPVGTEKVGASPCWCRNPRSTGASPVGTLQRAHSGLLRAPAQPLPARNGQPSLWGLNQRAGRKVCQA